MTIFEMAAGTFVDPLAWRRRLLAIWQWTHSMGSDAVNGSEPVSI